MKREEVKDKMADRDYNENLEDQETPTGSKGGQASDEKTSSRDLEDDSEQGM